MYTLFFLLYSLTFAAHTDEGPGMCPHGGRHQAALADDGGHLDPNGNRLAADSGGGMDPNGGHTSDAGVIIDPNG
jgi:hypothetical protein